eukprot:scaffold5143_cov119-Isochrysis_galbana.AAC.26
MGTECAAPPGGVTLPARAWLCGSPWCARGRVPGLGELARARRASAAPPKVLRRLRDRGGKAGEAATHSHVLYIVCARASSRRSQDEGGGAGCRKASKAAAQEQPAKSFDLYGRRIAIADHPIAHEPVPTVPSGKGRVRDVASGSHLHRRARLLLGLASQNLLGHIARGLGVVSATEFDAQVAVYLERLDRHAGHGVWDGNASSE